MPNSPMTIPQVQQQPIPDPQFGYLSECTGGVQDEEALRRQLAEDGYVLLRDVLAREEVLAARREVFTRLEEVGEVQSPASAGIASGQSHRRELAEDLDAFWKSVSEGSLLRRVTHGLQVRQVMTAVLGEPSRAHDLIYLRPAAVGRSTKLHYDFPFFARRSLRIHTAWIPFGDITLQEGPLLIVEGSHRFHDLIQPLRDHDYEADHTNEIIQRAAYEVPNQTDPINFAGGRGARLLSADFRAGDLLVFGGFTLHGSLDNCSPTGKIRLSCDVRYQPAADPADDARYFGPDPRGSNGGGYGDMKGAKPLTDPW